MDILTNNFDCASFLDIVEADPNPWCLAVNTGKTVTDWLPCKCRYRFCNSSVIINVQCYTYNPTSISNKSKLTIRASFKFHYL